MSTVFNEIQLRHAARCAIEAEAQHPKTFCPTDIKSAQATAKWAPDITARLFEKCFLVTRDVQVLILAAKKYDAFIRSAVKSGERIDPEKFDFAWFVTESWDEIAIKPEDQEVIDRKMQEAFGTKPPKEAEGQLPIRDGEGNDIKRKGKGRGKNKDDGSTAEPASEVTSKPLNEAQIASPEQLLAMMKNDGPAAILKSRYEIESDDEVADYVEFYRPRDGKTTLPVGEWTPAEVEVLCKKVEEALEVKKSLNLESEPALPNEEAIAAKAESNILDLKGKKEKPSKTAVAAAFAKAAGKKGGKK